MVFSRNERLFRYLNKLVPAEYIEEHFSFKRHTSVGAGGVASFCVTPPDAFSAAKLYNFLRASDIPHYIMGVGANVLPPDGVYEGVIVRFTNLNTLEADGNFITAGAGVTGGTLLRFACYKALSGAETFSGIPTSVGGGVAMNAGIAVRHFADLCEEVTLIEGNKLVTLPKNACAFGEKTSVFLENTLPVVRVKLKLMPSTTQAVWKNILDFRARRAHLPKGRSMGCTFVNPKEGSAGALIERCGLKGCSVGRAFVSPVHANFIINEGSCADDIKALIALVKRTVFEKTGVKLREEIRYI